MDSVIDKNQRGITTSSVPVPLVIYIDIVWKIVITIASTWLSITIFQTDDNFFGLGRTVKLFVGLIVLVPAVLAVLSVIMMLMRRPAGRFVAMMLDYVIMVLGGFVLVSMWGVFVGMDNLSPAILNHYGWLIGLPIAWALWWIGGRLQEGSALQMWVERAAITIGGLTLIVFLLSAGILDAANAILSTYGQLQTWIATAVVLFSGIMAYRLLRLGAYFRETPEQQAAWQGWLMLSPNIIGFMLFFAGPLLLSFYLSFTNDTVGSVPEFIGLQNYGEILSLEIASTTDLDINAQNVLSSNFTTMGEFRLGDTRYVLGARDPLFWFSLRNTIAFCLLLLPLSVLPALLLSMILNSKLAGMKFFRAVYFLPSVAAVVGTALIWRWLYDPVIGFINYAIRGVVEFFGGTNPDIQWLTDPSIQLFAIVLLAAWQVVGFNTVLFLAGLQGIPNTLYEAAFVDGANRLQRFRFVTIPMLAPTTFFVLITTIITGLQVFNEPYALIFARPMPVNATTVVFYLYNRGFFRFEFGYASSVAWVLFVLIFVITLVQFRVSRSRAYDE